MRLSRILASANANHRSTNAKIAKSYDLQLGLSALKVRQMAIAILGPHQDNL